MAAILRQSSRHSYYSDLFCIRIIQTCFENIFPPDIWSLADEYPDLVTRLHTQARLMGSFDLNGSVPWLKDTEGALCFICKEDVENTYHFFLNCTQFKEILTLVWRNLQLKVTRSNPTDGSQLFQESKSSK